MSIMFKKSRKLCLALQALTAARWSTHLTFVALHPVEGTGAMGRVAVRMLLIVLFLVPSVASARRNRVVTANVANSGASGEIDVTTFGAVGDGQTDDTNAIRSALQSAPNGAAVYFPPGVYRLSGALSIVGKGLKLCGGGWTTSYLNFGPTAANITSMMGGSVIYQSDPNSDAIDFDPGSDRTKGNSLSISNLVVVGSGQGSGVGIKLSAVASDYTVMGMWSDVGVFNFSLGVYLANAEDYTFVHLVASNNVVGLQLANAANQDVFVNLVCDGDWECATIDGVLTDVFLGGLVQGSTGQSGAAFDVKSCDTCRIEGLHFENALPAGSDALRVTSCRTCTIASNRFTGTGNSIHLLPYARQMNVTGNSINGPMVVEEGASGMAVENLFGPVVDNQSPGLFVFVDHRGATLPCFSIANLPIGKAPGFQACVTDWAGLSTGGLVDGVPNPGDPCVGGGTHYAFALFDGDKWSCH